MSLGEDMAFDLAATREDILLVCNRIRSRKQLVGLVAAVWQVFRAP
jgi:hypothetical protein